MTLKEKLMFIKELEDHGKRISASSELSKIELQKAGINSKDGKLTKHYK